MTKPEKPEISIPEAFAVNGQKTDFLEEKIQNGFDPVDPDVLAGDNLNKFIDDTYKGLNYSINGVSDLYRGAVLYDESETYNSKSIVFNIDDNGEVTIYLSLIDGNIGNPLTDETKWSEISLAGGGGLEIGDIGIAALGIDESKGLRRYLNGSTLDNNSNTQAFINKLKSAAALYPSLVCTETEWQAIATASALGQCGKFVINYDTDETTVTSIRLPKIIMPIQGLTDLSKLGELVEAGLPNIEGSHGGLEGHNFYTAGAFTIKDTTQRSGAAAGSGDCYVAFDASLYNSIYGNSDTVQQEQIQYPYFIQIATGVEYEVDIVNEIELNNPFTLFDSKYAEAPLYNASWLLSNGEYYPKSIYVTAYEALVVENNAEITAGESVTLPSGTTYVKRGLSVKLSTDEDITDYDFVINTTDETFRLPIKTNLSTLTTNSDLYLYYYVGETVQNANLINAGRILERLSDLTDSNISGLSMPSETYIDLTLGDSGSTYTAPANGWVTFKILTYSSNHTVVILENTSNGIINGYATGTNAPSSGLGAFIPVKKGDIYSVEWQYITTYIYRFIYAEGEV